MTIGTIFGKFIFEIEKTLSGYIFLIFSGFNLQSKTEAIVMRLSFLQ